MEDTKRKNHARAAKALHEKNSKARADAAQLIQAEYIKASGSPVLEDLLAKARSFANYHTRLAQQGVGARQLEGGGMAEFALEPAERLSHLDKADGILELLDYVERQLKVPAATVVVSDDKPEDESESEAEAE